MADDKKFTEDAYEQTLIALFRDELGYAYECGYEVERDYKEPFYRADLVASMRRLNPQLPADAMDKAHDLFEPILSKMISLRMENSRLSLLRDTLLPRLMSGELEVPE